MICPDCGAEMKHLWDDDKGCYCPACWDRITAERERNKCDYCAEVPGDISNGDMWVCFKCNRELTPKEIQQ